MHGATSTWGPSSPGEYQLYIWKGVSGRNHPGQQFPNCGLQDVRVSRRVGIRGYHSHQDRRGRVNTRGFKSAQLCYVLSSGHLHHWLICLLLFYWWENRNWTQSGRYLAPGHRTIKTNPDTPDSSLCSLLNCTVTCEGLYAGGCPEAGLTGFCTGRDYHLNLIWACILRPQGSWG
jgi:hypothetical protein